MVSPVMMMMMLMAVIDEMRVMILRVVAVRVT